MLVGHQPSRNDADGAADATEEDPDPMAAAAVALGA
jgi:hypothetical protein